MLRQLSRDCGRKAWNWPNSWNRCRNGFKRPSRISSNRLPKLKRIRASRPNSKSSGSSKSTKKRSKPWRLTSNGPWPTFNPSSISRAACSPTSLANWEAYKKRTRSSARILRHSKESSKKQRPNLVRKRKRSRKWGRVWPCKRRKRPCSRWNPWIWKMS